MHDEDTATTSFRHWCLLLMLLPSLSLFNSLLDQLSLTLLVSQLPACAHVTYNGTHNHHIAYYLFQNVLWSRTSVCWLAGLFVLPFVPFGRCDFSKSTSLIFRRSASVPNVTINFWEVKVNVQGHLLFRAWLTRFGDTIGLQSFGQWPKISKLYKTSYVLTYNILGIG